jgi:hypothetical protein
MENKMTHNKLIGEKGKLGRERLALPAILSGIGIEEKGLDQTVDV